MPSTFDAADRARLLARIDLLRPEAPAQWGRLTAPGMVAHLLDAFAILGGERSAPRPPWLLRCVGPLLKRRVLHGPWPRGRIRVPAEFTASAPGAWEADLAALRAAVEAWGSPRPQYGAHPLLGVLTPDEWALLTWRHLDHHLTQFGV